MSHSRPVRVVLVGAHGHGRVHRANLTRLAAAGVAELVGVCDLRPVPEVFSGPDLSAVIAAVDPEVVVIATPIHTHVELARTAAEAGRAILLEKPPAPSLAAYRRLLTAVTEAGVPCQVGFQSLGSEALPAARALIAEGRIGAVRGIGGAGTWVRTVGYYERAAWAGRRLLDGVPVVDGALTNPFAHLVATALALDGSERADASVEPPELFHAYDIEADDTAALRLRTASGTPITLAVTLCAAEHRAPFLTVHGDAGRLTLYYTEDRIELTTDERVGSRRYERTDLLTDLVAHLREPARPLLVPLADTAGFMGVLEAIRLAPEPVAIASGYVRETGHGADLRRVVSGVDQGVLTAAESLRTFTEQEVPWAARSAASR